MVYYQRIEICRISLSPAFCQGVFKSNNLEFSNEFATFAREMKTNELKRFLREYGCREYATNVRGHDVWISPEGVKFRVPRHGSKEVPVGTLHSILMQAGINKE